MSNSALKVLAASGAKGDPVYVDDVFSTFLYLNDSSTSITINNGINLSENGGLIWGKRRDGGGGGNEPALYDTERGLQYELHLSETSAQFDRSGSNTVPTATTTGCTTGNVSRLNGGTGEEQVLWMFRKQPGFFDIVTYTGDGNSGRTVNHNLGSVPGFMFVKKTNSTSDFTCYHRSTGATKYGPLNDRDAFPTGTSIWNDTAPTATQFTVGDNTRMNNSGDSYVAYLFAHDAQDFGEDSDEAIIKCGSYSGNSGTQTIDVGFEAQWVLIKNVTSGSTDWFVVDVMRGLFDTSAVDAALIRANEADAEQTSGAGGARITPKSNGFGFLTESNLSCNRSGETYIYVAIRRPHKPASEFAATDLFNVDLGDANDPGFDTGFPVDMGIFRTHESTADFDIMTRLTGPRRLDFTAGTEANKANATFDYMDGWVSSGMASHIGWAWRRAPGYHDVLTYTGDGSTQTISHNLGVAPEMIWIKSRSSGYEWQIWTSPLGIDSKFELTNAAAGTGLWDDYTPTATNFKVIGVNSVNASSATYIAYLFASVSGISKIGKYTGTGSNIDVDCGFSAGARFVFIKRSDSTGDWYLYDSVRGIVAGNDPYLLMNSDADQVTNTDYIDPLNAGFTVTSSAPAALNTSGGTYVFYAIA